MSLAELLKSGEIGETEPDREAALKLLKASSESIAAAEDNVGIGHNEVALSLAYTAMLNAGRALMAAKGYRTSAESHHKVVVSFCAAVLPAPSSQLVGLFNRYRVRRHDIVYGEVEAKSVGESEAKTAIAKAEEFVALIEGRI